MTARLTVLAVALALAACGEQEAAEPSPGPRSLDRQPTQERGPQTYVEMTLRRPPRNISGDDVLISGTVAPSDATVTVRGEPAVVKNGEYRLRLKMRVGTNRFTVVARHPDQTNRRLVRVDWRPPPLVVPPPAVAESPSVSPPPAESAPSGLVPCIYGERAFCTPEENQAENEAEARCGPLDPTRIDEDGNYTPPPGC